MIDEHAQCRPYPEQNTISSVGMRLCREDWGIVIDALIEHAAAATRRKVDNSESTSDARADDCARLIGVLGDELCTVRRDVQRLTIPATVPAWR